MRLIQDQLDLERMIPVWFDPWQHQFDENPILALLHTVADQCNINDKKKLLVTIGSALGVSLLKAVSNLSVGDISEIAEKYEEERFNIREKRVKLKEYFLDLIETIRGKDKKRVVFFINDLDRCMPPQILKLLEALKLDNCDNWGQMKISFWGDPVLA